MQSRSRVTDTKVAAFHHIDSIQDEIIPQPLYFSSVIVPSISVPEKLVFAIGQIVGVVQCFASLKQVFRSRCVLAVPLSVLVDAKQAVYCSSHRHEAEACTHGSDACGVGGALAAQEELRADDVANRVCRRQVSLIDCSRLLRANSQHTAKVTEVKLFLVLPEVLVVAKDTAKTHGTL